MATNVFTIGAISSTVTVSNAKAQEWVNGYILAWSGTTTPVQIPENATQTQTLQAVHVHLMKYFRRTAIQAIAKEAGTTAENTTLAEQNATDWT
jgi:hypothetical protein